MVRSGAAAEIVPDLAQGRGQPAVQPGGGIDCPRMGMLIRLPPGGVERRDCVDDVADDVWLKDADNALDAAVGAAATVWSTAGEDALRPTRDHLQRDAMGLTERMIAVPSDAA